MVELRVPVGMVVVFLGLPVTLQAVVLVVEELGHLHVADRMMLLAQVRGQGPRAFTDPAQGRFRIAPRAGINQTVKRRQQMGIAGCDFLPPGTATTDTPPPPGRNHPGFPECPFVIAFRDNSQARRTMEMPP